MVKRLGSS